MSVSLVLWCCLTSDLSHKHSEVLPRHPIRTALNIIAEDRIMENKKGKIHTVQDSSQFPKYIHVRSADDTK